MPLFGQASRWVRPVVCTLKLTLDTVVLQAANIVWLIIFGWAAALGHLFAAIIQACTIVGIGTAITNLQLMLFALCADPTAPTSVESVYIYQPLPAP